MKRAAFEHILRAAGSIAEDTELVVIGSQAAHGSLEPLPEPLALSLEVDVYPRTYPERASAISAAELPTMLSSVI